MAFLPSWVYVLVGCFSASSVGASNISDMEPPLWKQSPGQFSDYCVENGKYLIDPWNFTERMGMYKILLNQTAKYFERFPPGNEQNILWGMPLQFGWQYRTGRLADPTGRTDCGSTSGDRLCVSVDSWWADLNYFLSSLPFLAAVDSGIMGISSDQVMLLPPPKDQTKFCYDVSSCRSSFHKTMNKWNAFYQYLQTPSSNFDDLLKYLWTAHTSTLQDTFENFEDRYDYYSKAEGHFQRNWVIGVECLAALRFPTTLIWTYKFQKGLPPRILLRTDVVPFISDFTAFQNTVLFALNVLDKVDKLTGICSVEKIYEVRSYNESS
ncbi:protein LEG1 homolog [Nycticebus coucang]|uniref:protein LEG1 homolog n=1 Tax=Nycticebus coucang TaxID=9470 RepID=UPI00234DC2FC|nr:protein LEG1 homolog [Nycticebus coucang]